MIKHGSEHGTMRSYVIGFLLSLILTFIPYNLVVNQTIKGNALLITILGFAVAQLIVQIVFFLHLGRGPKPNWNLYFFISTVGIILVVVGGSIFIINNLIYNMLPSEQTTKLVEGEGIYQIGGEETGACYGQYENHKVYIKNDQFYPAITNANKCDTLTFINEDKKLVEIAFGQHPDHDVYAGQREQVVRNTRPKSITLSETGTYHFHDHFKPDVVGQFIVSEQE